MKLKIAPFIVLFLAFGYIKAQDTETLRGTVSFVTSNNVYVKLNNTDVVTIGSILQLNGANCL